MRSYFSLSAFCLATAVATAVASLVAGQARADVYGYSQQTVTGLSLTGIPLDGVSVVAGTSASQAQGATPPGTAGDVAANVVFGTTDPAAAFVGTGTVAPNLFSPLGPINPDYIRSDSLVNAATNSFSTVAEGFLSPPGTSTATGSYSFSTTFTLATAATVTLTGNVSNVLNVIFNGAFAGQATAGNTFVVGFTNRGTGVTTTFAPTLMNGSITLTSTGTNSMINALSPFTITAQLAAGTYDASLQSSSRVFLTQAVPEPSSVAMLGVASVGLLAIAARCRKV